MPIYEYRCVACRRRVTVLTMRVGQPVDSACEHCGSRELERLMSRFTMGRSNDRRVDDLCDDAALDSDDPKAAARWVRRAADELGEDPGEDFDELVDDIEQGKDQPD